MRWIWLGLTAITAFAPRAVGAQAALGVESSEASQAAEQVGHWAPLIGNWTIVFEALDTAGAVQATFDGEWNFRYVAGGTAVQDAFFLPPRDVAVDSETRRFVGTGLRVVDPETGVWSALWTDGNAPGPEHWEGTSVPGKISFHRVDGDRTIRTEFRIDEEGRLRWEQREGTSGATLEVTQRVMGHRRPARGT